MTHTLSPMRVAKILGLLLLGAVVFLAPNPDLGAQGKDKGDKRPLVRLYGSKSWEEITFREELEALQARLNLTVVHVLESPPEDWKGERGFITAELFRRHLPPPYDEHEEIPW